MDYYVFPSRTFCLTGPKNFAEESFCVYGVFWYREMFQIKEGVSQCSVQFVFVTVPKKFVNEPFTSLEKFWCGRFFLNMRGRVGRKDGVSQFPVEIMLPHRTEKLRKVILPDFRKFLLSKNLMDKRKVVFSGLLVKNFLSHRTEELRMGILLFFSRNFWYQETLEIRERVSRFSVAIVLSHITKKFGKGSLPNFRKLLVW